MEFPKNSFRDRLGLKLPSLSMKASKYVAIINIVLCLIIAVIIKISVSAVSEYNYKAACAFEGKTDTLYVDKVIKKTDTLFIKDSDKYITIKGKKYLKTD